jgi:ABC-type multidrug transport system fused ATPase/permease subunit
VDQPGEGEASFHREIVFDRVGFRYGDGDPVLGDISLTIPKGKVVALASPDSRAARSAR